MHPFKSQIREKREKNFLFNASFANNPLFACRAVAKCCITTGINAAGEDLMDPALQTEYGFSRKQMILGLIAVFAVYGTTAYNVQTLNIARPRMAAELDGMPLYSWLMSIPALFGAFVTLIFGKFSDMYGRRIMLMVSLSFFMAGSVLCAISPTFIFLIVSNCVARIGSGALMMLCVSVLGDMFLPLQRSKWIGLLNIPAGIFALFGPTLGDGSSTI